MYRTKTMAVRRVAVATTLGLGLVGGIAGIAAADGGARSHDSTVTTAPVNTVGGTVLGYVAGTSISVLTKGAMAPTSYALDAATTISGLATGVTAPMVGDNVDLVLSSTTPVSVTSITIDAPHVAPPAMTIEGTVLAYVAGTSISVSTKDSTTPTLYALNASTTITGLGTGVTAPAVNDNVDLVLSTTTPVVVLSIKDEGVKLTPLAPVAPTSMKIEGTVTAFVAGTSISVTPKDSTTPTLYALDANTTITGLGTGVTAPAVGDNVDLWLSTTTPVVVLTIKDEAAQQGDHNQEGNSDENQSGEHGTDGNHGFGQGMSDQGNQGFGQGMSGQGNQGFGRGNSDHGSSNNMGSGFSVGSFSNGGFNAGGSGHGSSHN
ncbi:MAG TPA: hypothetical protein VII84_02585 [Acidimicrobiales bacterium]